MIGSIDSMDFSGLELPISEERYAVPLKCWQDVKLSDIWIPSSLLPSRMQPSNSRVTQGIFHTLETRDSRKQFESFSVYSEEEIFMSDSDEDILVECKEIEKGYEKLPENRFSICSSGDTSSSYKESVMNDRSNQQCKNKEYEYLEMRKKISNMKTMPSVDNLCNIVAEGNSEVVGSYETSDIRTEQHEGNTFNQDRKTTVSHTSLNEILDSTPEVNFNDFMYKEFLDMRKKKLEEKDYPEKEDSNQKKNKKKKKLPKHITLDDFLDDYKEQDLQNDCCNDYFRKLMLQKDKNDVQLQSEAEFPDLKDKDEISFVHGKTEASNSELISEPAEVSMNAHDTDCPEKIALSTEENQSMIGKLIIEYIPKEVSEDDIIAFLSGYGEIKNFSLETIGEFHKVYVELDLTCDIDWIIECLNGTEPFGASNEVLKCYKVD